MVQVRMLRDRGCIPNNVHRIRRRNLPIEPEMGGKRGKFLVWFFSKTAISWAKGTTKICSPNLTVSFQNTNLVTLQPLRQHTLWKFWDFSAIKILREINFDRLNLKENGSEFTHFFRGGAPSRKQGEQKIPQISNFRIHSIFLWQFLKAGETIATPGCAGTAFISFLKLPKTVICQNCYHVKFEWKTNFQIFTLCYK